MKKRKEKKRGRCLEYIIKFVIPVLCHSKIFTTLSGSFYEKVGLILIFLFLLSSFFFFLVSVFEKEKVAPNIH